MQIHANKMHDWGKQHRIIFDDTKIDVEILLLILCFGSHYILDTNGTNGVNGGRKAVVGSINFTNLI